MSSLLIALAVVSFSLLLIEVLWVPGRGITGALGLTLLLFTTSMAAYFFGAKVGLLIFFGCLGLVVLAFWIFLRSPVTIASSRRSKLNLMMPCKLSVGSKGIAISALHPAGRALFVIEDKEKQMDVITEGEFIEKDARLEVVEIKPGRVIVEER